MRENGRRREVRGRDLLAMTLWGNRWEEAGKQSLMTHARFHLDCLCSSNEILNQRVDMEFPIATNMSCFLGILHRFYSENDKLFFQSCFEILSTKQLSTGNSVAILWFSAFVVPGSISWTNNEDSDFQEQLKNIFSAMNY
jgi:hypothetical protein